MTRTLAVLMICALTTVVPSPRAAERVDAGTAASALKEALEAGARRAVELLGQPDGYLGNEDVRIPVPDKMERIARTMSRLGMGQTVEEFELGINRAAEAAAPLAREVFLDAIREMSFSSAAKIVRGKKHEATDYLREQAGPRLEELFQPIVSEQIEAVGATKTFKEMMDRSESLPFVRKPAVDLDAYVTEKALDGMFLMIAKEEEKIRKDPLSRTSDLLKKVFGGIKSGS